MEERRQKVHLHGSPKIMQMIEDTDAPKDKAILMILLQISSDLSQNTDATQKLYDEFANHKEMFNTHVVEEQTLLNQGKGLYTAMSWMMGLASVLLVIIVSMGGYILSSHQKSSDIIAEQTKINNHRITIVEENLKLLRRDVESITEGRRR